ncbi:MAG: MTAP family purine nucleoside phosphorylase [Candidatus Schekmanbacteria bacterium]|nr:MTAP family purine nucleoside phosphorylase [Candidatus Schekmanbacteria bacterium]
MKIKNPGIKAAVIGGSGAYRQSRGNWGREGEVVEIATPFGFAAPLHLFSPPDTAPFIFLSRHGETGYQISAPFVNYRANIWALKEMGIERIISWSGPGAISPKFKPGEYVIPHDLIDFTKNRSSTFYSKGGLGFIRQNQPFCPQGRQALLDTLNDAGLTAHPQGVYLCTEGPRLETGAEISYFSQTGADMVGMTLIPEAFLARELEMCYSALCYITNYAEGIKDLPYRGGELFEGTLPCSEADRVKNSLWQIGNLLPQFVERLLQSERTCHCPEAMLRYKKRGDIGPDWHEWVSIP